MLTLLLNVVGLKFSFETHFPTYIAETRDQLQPNTALNPEWLQALFSINSLDGETKADYQKALSELSNLSSSLKSLSENPELYDVTPLYYLNNLMGTMEAPNGTEALKALDAFFAL